MLLEKVKHIHSNMFFLDIRKVFFLLIDTHTVPVHFTTASYIQIQNIFSKMCMTEIIFLYTILIRILNQELSFHVLCCQNGHSIKWLLWHHRHCCKIIASLEFKLLSNYVVYMTAFYKTNWIKSWQMIYFRILKKSTNYWYMSFKTN